MQKQTSIFIHKPCHEDWNKMTPTQQGKFCSACSKQVVDFSLMSDTQILNYLSGQTGKVCGRFDNEQLERPLIETKIKRKKSWWMALTMPLLFLFDRSEAQDTKTVGDTTYFFPYQKDTSVQLMGKVAHVMPDENSFSITGKVVDENDNPLAGASIVEKGTNRGTTANNEGGFSFLLKNNDAVVTLVISYVGYESKEVTLSKHEAGKVTSLKLQPAVSGEVVVVGYASKRICSRTTGATAVITRITTFEKLDTLVKKAIGITKVFPNPAPKNSAIHIEIKQAGEYQLQLFDNNSRLVVTDVITTVGNKSIADFTIPANIASGIYYMRLINEQTKKSYTEKLIIQ